jgi:hypothetical protein
MLRRVTSRSGFPSIIGQFASRKLGKVCGYAAAGLCYKQVPVQVLDSRLLSPCVRSLRVKEHVCKSVCV